MKCLTEPFFIGGINVIGPMHEGFETILTKDALDFLAELHRKFNRTRKDLLAARDALQKQIDAGHPIKVKNTVYVVKILLRIDCCIPDRGILILQVLGGVRNVCPNFPMDLL